MPVRISVWRAGIANSGTPFILFKLKSSKIQLTGLTNQDPVLLPVHISTDLDLGFHSSCFSLLNFVSLSMVTLASSCYTRPPSPDKDALVGLLHTYVSLTLYSQATLFFANSLVQLLKSRILSFFKDLSDVRYVLNLLERLFHGLMIFMLMGYLNCTNYALSEFLLRLAGHIHPDPGPVKNVKNLSFCHWNLNGINARNGIKIPLIEAYNSVMHFDLLALSETFLDTSVEEEELFIQGFSKEIWRSDHPRDN